MSIASNNLWLVSRPAKNFIDEIYGLEKTIHFHKKANMVQKFKHIFFLAPLLLLCGFFWTHLDWASVNNTIDKKYPLVASISTEELKEKITQQEHLTIIDVRESEEFNVSHLPMSLNVKDTRKINFPLDTTIIVYCSVGLRSAEFAKKLTKRGYTNVFNLRGSIFEWANKGYPLLRGKQSVTVVHPYNKKWGSLVKKSLHAYQAN